jgi:hypothetical protein
MINSTSLPKNSLNNCSITKQKIINICLRTLGYDLNIPQNILINAIKNTM